MNLTQWLTSGKWRGAKVFSLPQLDGTIEFSVSLCWKADDAEIEDEWLYSHASAETLDKAVDSALSDPFTCPPRLGKPPACTGCGGQGCSCGP